MRAVVSLVAGVTILALLAGFVVWRRGLGDKGFCWDCGLGREHRRGYSPILKQLASAQADFRGNDRDGNGVQEFWKGDVAGLYGLLPKGSSEMIRLIDISVAGADAAPRGTAKLGGVGPGVVARDQYCVAAPKVGYRYKAISHADEAVPDPQRFAFCAFPDDYPRHGRLTFIVSEGNTVFKRDLGHGRGVDVFPDDDDLRANWTKLD